MIRKKVVIDCFESRPECVEAYRNGYAIVAVDVIRATTTAVTAVALGRKCFPVPSLEAAVPLAAKLPNPLLVGELGGSMPYGFDLNNSPADLEYRTDIYRPMILLTTTGTKVICGAQESQAMYVACLRNYKAQAAHLAAYHPMVAVIGAGSRGEFREEDQLCCAWIAEILLARGYEPQDARTGAIIEQWSGAPVTTITDGASADYLRKTGQTRDLDFILTHVNDLDEVYRFERGQVLRHAEELLLR
jgi:2-phosphosulfolactate phosphatase